ncbi:putative bifunctional diguanylate cyclase/phosphodiesterase [Shewanella ulleungensis]|uniref:GGDEF-domain containing protein n=1 Tax=Shewanella ulleungensis TaxID=2282699 RepID=A0ABQ2QH12_9GAMM|nr:bifunctional diguanylate cyclase/phosphodiesterase [Shewanella ulleungensis]MCL1149672.1 bifunctional diguanylate cyclase/phosphodiesterase [Shewanella ulleungensis]GGP80650.1 GGDEF-domain containing protein [Shewanella ulleungensis]
MTNVMIVLLCITTIAAGVIGFMYWRQQHSIRQLIAALQRQILNQDTFIVDTSHPSLTPLINVLKDLHQSSLFSTERDKLTGLTNRVGFKRKMLAKMPVSEGMLVLVDIKQFRFVNDLFGFLFGDKLLKAFSKRIESVETKPQFIARMNGNEFLLFFPQPLTLIQLTQLKHDLQLPFEIEQQPISIKMQLGVLSLAEHHADVSLTLRRLDLALKKAKTLKQPIAFYDQDDDKAQYRELLIINGLPKGLKQNQLFMVFQPKLDIQSGQCQQVEALIRWQHEGLGLISPSEFIPLAEQTGMIDILSTWVLEAVVSQQAKWREKGIYVKVALNLSSTDLDNPNLANDVATKLAQYLVPAECIMIEITESALMVSLEQTIITLNKLRDIGVKIAIDDFGTGHSSLAYLRFLPVDEVKIDKAFLDEFETSTAAKQIVKTSIELAKSLGFEVTVEGVESKSVLETLHAFGVDTIQGDYFAKPATADEFEHIYPQLTHTV